MPSGNDRHDDLKEAIAAMQAEVHNIYRRMDRLENAIERFTAKLDEDYLTRREHRPIAMAVYGFFALIGAAFVGVLWKLAAKIH